MAMIRHSIDVVRNAVQHLNPGQTPVLTCDQPLFTLAKQLQWKWPDTYGEDKLVVMFVGLHIEMTALKTLGNWLQGSGWPKHWYKQRSQLQEQQTHFFEQLTSHAPEEHTKSQRLPCTYSNGVPMTSTAPPIQKMMSTLEFVLKKQLEQLMCVPEIRYWLLEVLCH